MKRRLAVGQSGQLVRIRFNTGDLVADVREARGHNGSNVSASNHGNALAHQTSDQSRRYLTAE